jgi:hypothetical protein
VKPLVHASCLLLALVSGVCSQMTITMPEGFDDGALRSVPLPGKPEATAKSTLDMATLSVLRLPSQVVVSMAPRRDHSRPAAR